MDNGSTFNSKIQNPWLRSYVGEIREAVRNGSLKAQTSSSSAYRSPETGNSRCHYLHNLRYIYSEVGGLRSKAADVERWPINRKHASSGEIKAARVGRCVRIHLPSLKEFMENRATEKGSAASEAREPNTIERSRT